MKTTVFLLSQISFPQTLEQDHGSVNDRHMDTRSMLERLRVGEGDVLPLLFSSKIISKHNKILVYIGYTIS